MNDVRLLIPPAMLALGMLCVDTVAAANLAYELSAGLGHSDNITAAETNEQSEDIASVGLQVSLDQSSSRVRADLIGDVRYDEYLDDTFESELIGNVAANARFALVPERFDWIVADNFGQVLRDPFQPSTPVNRENVNNFVTGPDIWLNIGSQSRVRLGGRYALASYEDQPFDSATTIGELGFMRLTSEASSISVNARTQKVEYDEESLDADYDQQDAFLRYDITGARTQLAVDVGYTQLEREVDDDKEDGMLLRLDITRRMSAASTGSLRVGHEFTNSASAFAAEQGLAGVGLSASPGFQTARPFTRDYANLRWTLDRNRTGVSLVASYQDRQFDDSSLFDQTFSTFSASVRRDMTPRTSIVLSGAYSQSEFEVPGSDYDEVDGGLLFRWRWSEATSMEATYAYSDRSSDVVGGSYTENRIFLSIVYGRDAPRSTFVGPEFSVDRDLE